MKLSALLLRVVIICLTFRQLDIGLEKFETKQLFVRLVTPTFFVIITVVQLHYFHNDFMILSDPKNTSILNEGEEDDEDLNESSMQGGAVVDKSDKDDPSSSGYRFELSEFDSEFHYNLLIKSFIHLCFCLQI